jgi:hypothetical protein
VKKISTVNAEHYAWGEVCDGWHLVKQRSLSVIKEQKGAGQTRAAARPDEPARHPNAGEATREGGAPSQGATLDVSFT